MLKKLQNSILYNTNIQRFTPIVTEKLGIKKIGIGAHRQYLCGRKIERVTLKLQNYETTIYYTYGHCVARSM